MEDESKLFHDDHEAQLWADTVVALIAQHPMDDAIASADRIVAQFRLRAEELED